MNDSGVIPNNPDGDFVIGGRGQDSGVPGGASKVRISEVLIYQDALSAAQVSKLEGYLAHKWNLTNRLAGGHAYASSAPTFDDPVAGVDLTLYWGSNDGGENPAEWEQEVALGRFHKEQVDVNGFNGYGYQSTWRNDSYLRNVENLRSASHDQHAQLKGEPGGSQGMYFNGTADFINSGVIKNTNNNLGWEDNFMTLFTTTFTAPSTGNYQFKMDQKDDRHAMWIDLDQDGVFEGGSGTNGSASTNSGNEFLNPNMDGSNPHVNQNWTSSNIALTGGQQYLLAIAHWQGGGGAKIRPHIKIPGGSFVVMDPLDLAQDGYFTLKGLSNGRFLHEQELLEANGTNLVAGNTYYYRIKGTNSQGTDWADSTASFVSENALDTSTGTLTFNTDGPTPSWSASSGTSGTGQIVNRSYTDSSSNTVSYNVAVYNFDRLNIGDGVAVTFTGANPLEINVSGDATILSALDANGTEGTSVAGVRKSKLGGGYGGYKWDSAGWGAGTGPEHLTSADTFQSGGAQFKG
tara:strand:- start:48 stop:1601 length:1554 start_codon:yes stop_codon:yes gene_type:complete